MTGIKSFSVGDRVAHVTLGNGIVSALEGGRVLVTFERIVNGRQVVGTYDVQWFAMHPRDLSKLTG